jgi:hypothetical protein
LNVGAAADAPSRQVDLINNECAGQGEKKEVERAVLVGQVPDSELKAQYRGVAVPDGIPKRRQVEAIELPSPW